MCVCVCECVYVSARVCVVIQRTCLFVHISICHIVGLFVHVCVLCLFGQFSVCLYLCVRVRVRVRGRVCVCRCERVCVCVYVWPAVCLRALQLMSLPVNLSLRQVVVVYQSAVFPVCLLCCLSLCCLCVYLSS